MKKFILLICLLLVIHACSNAIEHNGTNTINTTSTSDPEPEPSPAPNPGQIINHLTPAFSLVPDNAVQIASCRGTIASSKTDKSVILIHKEDGKILAIQNDPRGLAQGELTQFGLPVKYSFPGYSVTRQTPFQCVISSDGNVVVALSQSYYDLQLLVVDHTNNVLATGKHSLRDSALFISWDSTTQKEILNIVSRESHGAIEATIYDLPSLNKHANTVQILAGCSNDVDAHPYFKAASLGYNSNRVASIMWRNKNCSGSYTGFNLINYSASHGWGNAINLREKFSNFTGKPKEDAEIKLRALGTTTFNVDIAANTDYGKMNIGSIKIKVSDASIESGYIHQFANAHPEEDGKPSVTSIINSMQIGIWVNSQNSNIEFAVLQNGTVLEQPANLFTGTTNEIVTSILEINNDRLLCGIISKKVSCRLLSIK